MMKQACIVATLCVAVVQVRADPPAIEDVSAKQGPDGWTIEVTLSHPDTGWEHYADGWRVLDMEGRELGLRELLHPHVTEQPFTRALSGVPIPDGTRTVRIEARCSVDGWSGHTETVTLP
ncbi:hypothetical protein JF290_11435 [Sedimentitalea sp. CAU 1593]|uniref:Uncharacterized protein n=2 Tax=Sedimentitalea arenosa TaxID=2798803 RepID=A0A8J7IKY6_9RHOB|nr:hypothetical protein [Arenibacterium arenosum]MBJ6372138.1 hypothetical protein [Arenibacterium arenosum]